MRDVFMAGFKPRPSIRDVYQFERGRVAQVLHLTLNLRVPHRRRFCEGGAFRFYRLRLSDRIDSNRR